MADIIKHAVKQGCEVSAVMEQPSTNRGCHFLESSVFGRLRLVEPPLCQTVLSVWSHHTCLWSKKAVFGRFGPFWGPSGAPGWFSLTRKTVPMHHRGCALPCSTLVPLCSTSLEPPDPLMAQKGRFWQFWTLWGPSGAPIWPSLTREMVSMHHQGCALTCSTLVPHCSTSLESPDPLMAQKGCF